MRLSPSPFRTKLLELLLENCCFPDLFETPVHPNFCHFQSSLNYVLCGRFRRWKNTKGTWIFCPSISRSRLLEKPTAALASAVFLVQWTSDFSLRLLIVIPSIQTSFLPPRRFRTQTYIACICYFPLQMSLRMAWSFFQEKWNRKCVYLHFSTFV